jgi:hypothetical protein
MIKKKKSSELETQLIDPSSDIGRDQVSFILFLTCLFLAWFSKTKAISRNKYSQNQKNKNR